MNCAVSEFGSILEKSFGGVWSVKADRVPTPALVIDEAAARRNIERLAAYGREHRIAIRPHAKTHKSLEVARWQMEAGAAGLTVAKAGEAERMAEAANDLLVAYPAMDPARSRALAQLARRVHLRVGLDSKEAAEALSTACRREKSTIGVLVEIDPGFHRMGVQNPAEALELALHISELKGLRLDGLMFFPGNIVEPPDRQEQALQPITHLLLDTLASWEKQGLEARVVSGGSTLTAYQSHRMPPVTEIRPGTYVYNDLNTLRGGACQLEDCAARVGCTIVSKAVPGKAIIDGGSKTFSSDRNAHDPMTGGFGYVVEFPEAKIIRLSEEHGELDITQCKTPPRLGQRVHVIPNHICPCVNLFDSAWMKNKRGDVRPLPIDTRGQVV
jgi:D-serine deaminase-like pyridoxal phosphate-dependent protein